MKRKPTPQYEFPMATEAFNLSGQVTEDGARLAAEAQASRNARDAAAKLQDELKVIDNNSGSNQQ